jgi:hypothetical protein
VRGRLFGGRGAGKVGERRAGQRGRMRMRGGIQALRWSRLGSTA